LEEKKGGGGRRKKEHAKESLVRKLLGSAPHEERGKKEEEDREEREREDREKEECFSYLTIDNAVGVVGEKSLICQLFRGAESLDGAPHEALLFLPLLPFSFLLPNLLLYTPFLIPDNLFCCRRG
jgi:hypothetical protein